MMAEGPQLQGDALEFIANSPLLFILSGTDNVAPDVSPRGDPRGFVKVVGQNRLILPDRVGNNRLDTMSNVLVDPHVAVVFLCPGETRVLQVFGTASVSTDPQLTHICSIKGKPPHSVMVIDAQAAAFVDAESLTVSGFWTPERFADSSSFSFSSALAEQVGGKRKESETTQAIREDYETGLY